MAKKLTAGVLQGVHYSEPFEFDWRGEQYEVDIRPLSNKEAVKVESLRQKGIGIKANAMPGGKMHRSMSFDIGESTAGRSQGDILTVALGTLDDTLTEDVVAEEFPPKVVKDIAERIRAITGIVDESDDDDAGDGSEFPEGV